MAKSRSRLRHRTGCSLALDRDPSGLCWLGETPQNFDRLFAPRPIRDAHASIDERSAVPASPKNVRCYGPTEHRADQRLLWRGSRLAEPIKRIVDPTVRVIVARTACHADVAEDKNLLPNSRVPGSPISTRHRRQTQSRADLVTRIKFANVELRHRAGLLTNATFERALAVSLPRYSLGRIGAAPIVGPPCSLSLHSYHLPRSSGLERRPSFDPFAPASRPGLQGQHDEDVAGVVEPDQAVAI